jgi:hypothetical protein
MHYSFKTVGSPVGKLTLVALDSELTATDSVAMVQRLHGTA